MTDTRRGRPATVGSVARVARRANVAVAAALASVLTAAPLATLPAQGYFGQNHVQYDQFEWRVLETEHFQVHFYQGLEETARIAGQMAERTYARLSRVLGHEFREKKPIIVFGSRTDFAQNNIFGDLGEGTGGVTDWLRQRNTLYFIGDYGEFEHILAHEMVHVFQYDIFSRGRAGANMQALARVQPPLWYMEGMAEYLSVGPHHPHTDAVIRDAALNGKIPTIEQMTRRPDLYFPYRYGESLWEYIGSKWGDRTIGAIMNAVPAIGIERAVRRELGLSLEELGDEWREAMQVAHLPLVAERRRARHYAEPLLTERRTGGAVPIYVAPSLSPDGDRIAYLSTGNFFRAEVFLDLYLADTKTGKRIARLTKSVLDPDYEELRAAYSQSAFSPDGQLLAFTTQSRGKDVLELIDVKRRKRVRRFEGLPLEQMIGPTFSPDGQRIAFVGTQGSRSDLYVINVDGTGLRRLTNDLTGDAQPSWSPDGRHIAFASERGPQTDVDVLRFGKWRISVLDVETGAVEVLPGQAGHNRNPQWSPDSRSIAYVSDRTGIPNIFLYEVAEREHYQLTDVFSAVSSFTDQSPAISWARRADKLAFVYFENGDYSVWWINNPRRHKGAPFRPTPATTVASAATPAVAPSVAPALVDSVAAGADSVAAVTDAHAARSDSVITSTLSAVGRRDSLAAEPRDTTPLDATVRGTSARDTAHVERSVLLDSLPERLSVYRGAAGIRAANAPVAGEGGPAGVSVAALLDSAALALPDTSSFRIYDYRAGFTPEYISQPSIGYAQDNFGKGMYGGTAVVLSDLLGNHRLIFAGAINGRISEAQLYAAYANFARRLQYVASVSQTPYFVWGGGTQQVLANGDYLLTSNIHRYIFREASAAAVIPRDRFTRFELGARLSHIGITTLEVQEVIDGMGFFLKGYGTALHEGESAALVAPYVAYVSDNALLGYTSPILGRRFRFQVSPVVGGWQWTEILADYRRYDPILFNLLTVATRVRASARIGRDEGRLSDYLYPEYIRGYDRELYNQQSCIGAQASQCVDFNELRGSRIANANAELRFPVVRRLDLGFLPISLPPVDGHLFYDAAVAWRDGQRVVLSRAQSDDPAVRSILTSWGAGVRFNLFGLAILRLDYAIPLAQPGHKGHWTWMLGNYGF
ncbi:MAG TPA: hypothetical protein VFX39_01760 [Gemmatimonadaceae bacterium]|nr:hypothetical protein [Gemmatimonadaceae bacterium]